MRDPREGEDEREKNKERQKINMKWRGKIRGSETPTRNKIE